MSDLDYKDVLDRPVDDIEPRKAPPMGTWRLQVISGKAGPGKGDNGPAAEFRFMSRLILPTDDVSEVELEEFGDGIEGARVSYRVPIFEKGDEWNVVRFLADVLGVEKEPGEKLGAYAARAKGYEFNGYLKHRDNPNDPENPFVDVTAPTAID